MLAALLVVSCASPGLADPSHAPGDYGRPAIVRGCASTGAYVGAVVGIVASVVLWLPVQGLTALVDEPLGYSKKEWSMLPLTACTSAGHYLFGLPAEAVYQVGYGLWVEREQPAGFDDVPAAAPGSGPGSGHAQRE